MSEEFYRTYRGMPVIEARDPLKVYIASQDVKGAEQKSFENCVLARACKRMFNASMAHFHKTIAYVEMPDADGVRCVYRYTVTGKSAECLREYDRTGKFPAGITLTLSPPRPAAHLSRAHAYRQQLKQDKQLAADMGIEWSPKKGVGRKPGRKVSERKSVDTSVRSGTGLAHFSKNPPPAKPKIIKKAA